MAARDEAALSRWTGEFLDAGYEQAFLTDAWPRLSRQLRLIALIAGSVYIAALYMDWQGFGDSIAFRTMAALRLGTGATFIGIAYASRASWPPRRVHVLFLVTILFMVTTRLAETYLTAPALLPGSPGAVPLVPVMPLVIFAVIAIPVRLALIWSSVGSLLFLRDQVILWGYDAAITQVLLLDLLLANGAGYAFRVAWNRIAHRDFALRQDLEREVAERQRAERAAQRANEAKSRFLTVLSHEIRTPLNGVLGGLQILQETALQPEQRQPLEILSRSGDQLATLVDDVLDLARIEAGHLELEPAPFCPLELLASVHAVLYPQARSKGLALRLEHPSDLPLALVGDALRLRQVLINLAGNAVKFTEQGEVVLSLACASEVPGQVRCSFVIRDTGPGLGEDTQIRIFAPFEQGDSSIHRRHGGVGLGLAISRELVAAMGGEVIVDSAPGQGCVFRFGLTLPLGEAPQPIAVPMAASRSLSILVVDDLEANRIVAQGLLASLGHRAQTASGGAEALELLQQEPFDAVLLDLHLQDTNGLEVLRRIRALPTGNLPVFLVTADTERTHLQACLAEGFQGLLAKPVRKDRLGALLSGVHPQGTALEPEEAPLLDTAQAAQILADLGPAVWEAGVGACRVSMEASLEALEQPGQTRHALHRLAGVSASYGLARLHQQVRRAEALVTTGDPCPLGELRDLAATSLAALEATLGIS